MMRPTLRRNDTHMVTLRLRVDLDGIDMVYLLVRGMTSGITDIRDARTRSAAETAVRRLLPEISLPIVYDGIFDDWEPEPEDVATAVAAVRLWWPEMTDVFSPTNHRFRDWVLPYLDEPNRRCSRCGVRFGPEHDGLVERGRCTVIVPSGPTEPAQDEAGESR